MRSIIVTGGLGFIGSNLVRFLNARGIDPIVIDKDTGWERIKDMSFHVIGSDWSIGPDDVVVHLGARVDTTEKDSVALRENNVDYSLKLRTRMPGRFIYASSGAIYGNEECDNVERITDIHPMNAYAQTKLELDIAFHGVPNTYGLRFFNVYGSGEAHKGNMKSLVSRALDIKDGVFEIFKTGRADIPDGEQARDFIHVEDVCRVIWHFITTEDTKGGLFNVGTGVVTSFNQVADILGLQKRYVDMPEAVKAQYQYRTCADLTKLRAHGYTQPFMTVAEGIAKMRSSH